MQEKPNDLDTRRNKRLLGTLISKQFTNHQTRTVLTGLIIFLVIILILITIVPKLFVNWLIYNYGNSTEAEMHITASSNLIIAFITLLYVVLTGVLVLETREMRKFQTEPNIDLLLVSRNEHNDIMDLFIQNSGMGAAFNIRFDVLSDFIFNESKIDKEGKQRVDSEGKLQPKLYRVSQAKIINDGIKYLAPGQKKRLFSTLFYYFENINLKNNLDNILIMNVKYEYKNGIEKNQEFMISFYEVPANGMVGLTRFEKDLLNELKGIKKEMHNISTKIENEHDISE